MGSKDRVPLSQSHPGLALEFHPTKNGDLTPADITRGTNKKLWWLCKDCQHEWLTTGNKRTQGRGCPACAGKAVHIDGRNSLFSISPDISSEWHPEKNGDLTPSDVTCGTGKKIWWLCKECQHEWLISGDHRKRGRGCPACAGKAVHIDGRNSLASISPNIAAEWHTEKNGDLFPSDVVAGTHQKIWWLCKDCEHEWVNTGSHRTSRDQGCPACAGKAVHIDGRNSLASLRPNYASEWHPEKNGDLTLDEVTAGTGKKIWWLCKECQHEWLTSGQKRKQGRGCPSCAGNEVHIDGRNSMASISPDISSEWHPEKNGDLTPSDVISGTGKKIWWLCKDCEHEWVNTGSHRTSRDQGCPACAGKAVHIDGRNSLASISPNIASEWHPEKNRDLTPDDVVEGTHQKIWWLCKDCDHEWLTSGGHRKRGRGCPACAPTGFQPHLPGQYYVHEIINKETKDRLFFKAGISGDWEERMAQLIRGLPDNMIMNNLEVIEFEIGRDALDLETRLKAIHGIRSPRRSFDGGDELFLVNPLDYARENNIL